MRNRSRVLRLYNCLQSSDIEGKFQLFSSFILKLAIPCQGKIHWSSSGNPSWYKKNNNKVPWEIKIMFLDTLDFLQTRDNPSTTPLKVKFLHFFAYSCKTLGFCNSDKIFLWNKILIFFCMKTGLTLCFGGVLHGKT